MLTAMTEAERFRLLAGSLNYLGFELSLAPILADPTFLLDAYGSLLQWKGQLARQGMSDRARLLSSMTQKQLILLEELRSCQKRLSGLTFVEGIQDQETHGRQLVELRDERNRIELQLQRSLENTLPPELRIEELQSALPERSAFLDFFVHRVYFPAHLRGDEVIKKGAWSEPALSLWIVRPDRPEVTRLMLGSAAAIEDRVALHLRALVRGEAPDELRGIVADTDDDPGAGASLRTMLWDPIAPHLEDVETLFVSADGFLGTLPLEVLQPEDGGYLLERFAFVYIQDVAALARREAGDSGGHGSLLSAGGIDYRTRTAEEHPVADSRGAPSLRGGFTSLWGRLPATEHESRVVLDLHADAFRGGERLLLQGSAASEERLKRELPRHSVLHLATHGFFQPEGLPSMWESALNEAGMRETKMRAEPEFLLGYHPGLLTGLVCSGANAEAPEGRDDGYLTAEEVGWLDLSGVDLVVLSACETALGEARSGEGLIGLRRAFQTAGAKTVISSLWSVKDESTSELMQVFYRNLWQKGMGKSEALRQAQLDMLDENRREHGNGLPSTWGAFVLSGDWR